MSDSSNQRTPESSDSAALRIAVCMITLERPQGLQRLLEGIAALTFEHRAVPDIRVIVVENDSAGPSRSIVESMQDRMPWPIRFGTEGRRGIPFARNAAIELAGDDVDFVTFLDDDEWPEPQWLEALLDVQERLNADVVTGPVMPHLEDDAPAWVARGEFFQRPLYPDETRVLNAATGNVLIRRSVLSELDPMFDGRLHLTGADDTHLFRRLRDRGAAMHFASKAIAHESIPASRANAPWLIRRMLRIGSSMTWIECDVRPGLPTTLTQWMKGLVWMGIGALQCLLALVRRTEHRVEARRSMAYGYGLIVGLFGRSVAEYERIHGS